MNTSFVVRRLSDGKAMMETWSEKLAKSIQAAQDLRTVPEYEVVPILEHLASLNNTLKTPAPKEKV